MPKIEIIEKDYTTPGIGDYANFSVVVPGFCGKPVAEGIFDDNGIYEVSSQSDFLDNIGPVSAGNSVRVFAKPELINYSKEHVDPMANYLKKLTGEEFYSTYKGEVYTVTVAQNFSSKTKGKGIIKIEVLNDKGEVATYRYYETTKAES